MKINQNLDSGAIDKLTKPKTTRQSSSVTESQDVNSSTKVEFSSFSKGVEAGEAPFDQAKVDALRKAIAEGTFKVNPEIVADAMISSARSFAK